MVDIYMVTLLFILGGLLLLVVALLVKFKKINKEMKDAHDKIDAHIKEK